MGLEGSNLDPPPCGKSGVGCDWPGPGTLRVYNDDSWLKELGSNLGGERRRFEEGDVLSVTSGTEYCIVRVKSQKRKGIKRHVL